jgi:zeaxanthin glucosyltransferase
MAHYGILMVEAMGHLLPVSSLANELRRRGHTVTLVTSGRIAPAAQQLGLPISLLPTPARSRLRKPPWPWAMACRRLFRRDILARWFRFPGRTRMHLEFSPAAVRELGVDILLVDQHVFAGSSVAEHLGLPFVTIGVAMHWIGEPDVPPPITGWPYAKSPWSRWRNRVGYGFWDWYVRPSMEILNRFRKEWRLPPLSDIDQTFSPLAVICQTCPEFDYPRNRLPATFHYAGSLAADRPGDAGDFPWDRLDGRPLIYASLGTLRPNRKPAVFRRMAEACSGLDAQLVISAGKWLENERIHWLESDSLPGAPLVLPFVPQLALLEKACLVIGHAGLNTVLESLTRGVPMVVMPQAADQFGTAGRIEHTGVGLRSRQGSVASLRQMIQRVLGEESFRQRAGELQAAMLATGGVRHAADIAEQACETRRPVLRSKTSD